MAFVNEKPQGQPELWRTIDYERAAMLKCDRGIPYGGGSIFTLEWQNEIVRFGAYETIESVSEPSERSKNYHKTFTLFSADIPKPLLNQKDQIKSLIQDALAEYKEIYEDRNIVEVTINFENVL